VQTQAVFRDSPSLTQLAFSRLLAWLDEGIESHGARYLEMRRRLVTYFDRRNRSAAEELADETLNRIARKLEQSGTIVVTPPARYCYVVARFVLLEDFRHERRHVVLDEPRIADASLARAVGPFDPDSGRTIQDGRLDSLDQCLAALKPEQRELIVEYYRDDRRQKIERRRELAGRLGISMNALGIRVCRLRDALLTCIAAARHQQRKV
jgi:DNA-directed RNA polymerase specialized sigma24 family protein